MRHLHLAALLLLVGCSSQDGLMPAPANAIPAEVTMRGLEDSLALRVGSRVAWKIDSQSNWLNVSPSSGVGPKVVQLRADFDGDIASQALYTATLTVSGDQTATVNVRLPLARVSGRVAEAPAAASFAGEQPGVLGLRPLRAERGGEVLVKYRRDLRSAALPQGARVLSHDRASRLTKLLSPNPQALVDRLRLDPSVEWAEVNGLVSAQGEPPGGVRAQNEPSDSFYPQQWYLRATGARFADQQAYGTPVTVAVVDTGVRYDHPDLAGRLWRPGEGAYDFVGDSAGPDPCGDPAPGSPGDPDPSDPCDLLSRTGGSHGTHVTGIVVANSGTFPKPCPDCSDSGLVGMAYNAPVKVLPLRVLDSLGNGTFEDVALAVRYAAGLPVEKEGRPLQNPRPAQVINLSLGATVFSNVMCEAIADVTARGVVVVAAAGNFQNRSPGALVYPAACPGAVSVAATDQNNHPVYYSQQNDQVDVAAPGGNTAQTGGGILSTTWNYSTNVPNYTFYMGTSQATPQVVAAVAMALSAGKAATAPQAWELLKSKLTDLGAPGRDRIYGDGFLNLPGVFGWALPRGGFVMSFSGPSPRRLPVVDGAFQTYLVPGPYAATACRDDSANGLCDQGEPSQARALQIGGDLDLGEMLVRP